MRRVAIALVHYPVLDAGGGIVTSAITNLDVHDLARSARAFGASDYFIVHPITAQRELVEKIKEHWATGSSGKRIPARKDALALVRTVPLLEDAYAAMGGREAIEVWTTGAKAAPGVMSMGEARAKIEAEGKAVLVVFGTAWGLGPILHGGADGRLAPIVAARDTAYNHISVRAACAIYMDRLLGAREVITA
jgi:hypothetical protein